MTDEGRHMAAKWPPWCRHVRNFVATIDFQHLSLAIDECPAEGTSQYMKDLRDNPDGIPPLVWMQAAGMLRSSGADVEAAMVELLGDIDMAILAEYPERIGEENSNQAANLCVQKVRLCRTHCFPECEAAFLRILAIHSFEQKRFPEALQFVKQACELYDQLPSEMLRVCHTARMRAYGNLEAIERQAEREDASP